jgi:hypothetical protein
MPLFFATCGPDQVMAISGRDKAQKFAQHDYKKVQWNMEGFFM